MATDKTIMTKNEIRSIILSLLKKKQSLNDVQHIDELNYFEQGIIDSISLIKFVIELEEAFTIDIESHDISKSSFKTVGGLVDLIYSKINEQ